MSWCIAGGCEAVVNKHVNGMECTEMYFYYISHVCSPQNRHV